VLEDVGSQWVMREKRSVDASDLHLAKSTWRQQHGMCAYCDVATLPPDGVGVGTSCQEYMTYTNRFSDRAKLCRMKENVNHELGKLVSDRILYQDSPIFVCLGCALACDTDASHRQVEYAHSEALFPHSVVDYASLFLYLQACSGLHLVFSIFVCEATQDDAAADADRRGPRNAGDGGDGGDAVVPSPGGHGHDYVTLMAYVTNYRESEVVHVKMPEFALVVNIPHIRRRLRNGIVLRNPGFTLSENTPRPAAEPPLIVAGNDGCRSRWHVYHCIYTNVVRQIQDIEQIQESLNLHAGRFFAFICQKLVHFAAPPSSPPPPPPGFGAPPPPVMFPGAAPAHNPSSNATVWDRVCSNTIDMYAVKSTLDAATQDCFFRTTSHDQLLFREQTVLVAHRDTRLRDNNSLNRPTIGPVSRLRIHNTCQPSVGARADVPLIDCIVLLQTSVPTCLLTAVQNHNHHHLFRLTAVFVPATMETFWLDTENWPGIACLPIPRLGTDRNRSWVRAGPAPAQFDPDLCLNFNQIEQNLQSIVFPDDPTDTTRYVCFYQRLTRNTQQAHATPTSLSSPHARRQARILQKMFGNVSYNPLGTAITATRHAAGRMVPTPSAWDLTSMNCIRMMAVAVKLLGHLLLHELNSTLAITDMTPASRQLFEFVIWNRFVIGEGFQGREQDERVYARVILGHDVHRWGCIDVDVILQRFRRYLAHRCNVLYTSRDHSITRAADVWRASMQHVFAHEDSLVREFQSVVDSVGPCSSAKHVIRNLRIYTSHVARRDNKNTYLLGNTKLMLHYFSRVLPPLKHLQEYFSEIRNALI